MLLRVLPPSSGPVLDYGGASGEGGRRVSRGYLYLLLSIDYLLILLSPAPACSWNRVSASFRPISDGMYWLGCLTKTHSNRCAWHGTVAMGCCLIRFRAHKGITLLIIQRNQYNANNVTSCKRHVLPASTTLSVPVVVLLVVVYGILRGPTF